ncbi:hypothetical protein [Streptomyces chryseus]|uniref:Uncharacterized protein n=1 Tax=Streptomyces chryseus TaxID=68186 RepID=A0ABQ3DPI6_9ACTN|nr:hypothetical protein [Streptomyces chryseus]GHA95866.1 hypothetical protein GCM10010346_18040 [Streptomyces chryseus]
MYERVNEDPARRTHAVESGHNVLRGAPEDLSKLVLGAAGDQPGTLGAAGTG